MTDQRNVAQILYVGNLWLKQVSCDWALGARLMVAPGDATHT